MRGAKRADRALQRARIDRRRHVADLDPPQLAALGQRRELAAALQVLERGARFAEVGLARGAQRDRAPRPVEQAHAQQPFRFLDLPRERRRRHVELVGRAGEMEMARDGEERADMTEFEAVHDCGNRQ